MKLLVRIVQIEITGGTAEEMQDVAQRFAREQGMNILSSDLVKFTGSDDSKLLVTCSNPDLEEGAAI